ncbi:LLM class flavin-dependent oxidoreductase [Geodermatophilus sp. SYSU D00703]
MRPFAHTGPQFDVRGTFGTPRGPQGHPVLFQAGDSADGREFAARDADVVFTAHSTVEAGQACYADVKGRLAAHGRQRDDLKILPAVTVVLGDTGAEARDRARHIREQQVSGPTAIAFLSRCGAATSPRTTRTGHCRRRTPTRRASRSPADGSATTATRRRRPGSGGSWPRPTAGRSASWSSRSATAAASSGRRSRSRGRSTTRCRPTRATATSSCRT